MALCCMMLASLAIADGGASAEQAAKVETKDIKTEFAERKQLFDEVSEVTGIPWNYLAAVDQYERTLSIANPKKRPRSAGLIGIYYSELDWAGIANPDQTDTNPASIALFGGRGKDGSGDGVADRANDLDVLSTMASYLLTYGTGEDQFKLALWNYYHNQRSVERIQQFYRIYAEFGRIDLHEHAFPLPLGAEYSYRSTWGASRGWGGHRMHEGTDLFAGHGVPVRSTCYGIVEIKGWNPYGGWRVGLRDLNNVYHYYAHLSGFEKKLKQGDIVKPGQVLGWVGSSGYGKPGTQGKFPPHLHFGLYRDNGKTEWSFDPFAYLKKWEREERLRGQKKSGS
ncbi:M23 family metallopeptidase [Paenibacillus hemerocallicola]|uniref:M23 family metallopeptidase n=1 Tax=Paenibacillus hemerocallicola TaxID=1172614 RepID=A0A5C4T8L1_9BACL|nr:M23 family metallopeptidase [Paenibacillus hemerocallicola]